MANKKGSTELWCYTRRRIIVDILRNRNGEENAITSVELSKILSAKGYETKPFTLQTEMSKIRLEENLPILQCKQGYYLARTQAEVQKCIENLKMRQQSLAETISVLENYLVK